MNIRAVQKSAPPGAEFELQISPRVRVRTGDKVRIRANIPGEHGMKGSFGFHASDKGGPYAAVYTDHGWRLVRPERIRRITK